jgi:hypothetical protein
MKYLAPCLLAALLGAWLAWEANDISQTLYRVCRADGLSVMYCFRASVTAGEKRN